MKRTKLTLLAAPALLLIVAACGTPSATPTPDGGGGGGGTEATATPDGGGGGGGGGNIDDVEGLAAGLVPPNSDEQSRIDAEGGLFIVYESTDSPDSMRSFYEGKFPELGVNVIATSNAADTTTWVIGNDDGTGVSGGVSVGPSTSGGGSVVSLTLGIQS